MTQAPAPRRKVDRDEVFVEFMEFTKSICPVCKTPVGAQVNTRENKVYLRKRCADAVDAVRSSLGLDAT